MRIVYHYRGTVERGNGKPGYDQHAGYSENAADGSATFPWMTRRECQADARARGAVADFANPENYKAFIHGFQSVTGLTFTDAEEQWAGFSRQLDDGERNKLEQGGVKAGRSQGLEFVKLYPPE